MWVIAQHCCSNVIEYSWTLAKEMGKCSEIWFPPWTRVTIQDSKQIYSTSFAYPFRQDESWPAPSDLFPSKGILDFWFEGEQNCLYPDSYLGQQSSRLRVNVWRLMLDTVGHFMYNHSWGTMSSAENWVFVMQTQANESCPTYHIRHASQGLKNGIGYRKDDLDLLRDLRQINHSVTSSWQPHFQEFFFFFFS